MKLEEVRKAVDCYNRGEELYITWTGSLVSGSEVTDEILDRGHTVYRGEEILSLIASDILGFKPPREGYLSITPTIYRNILEIFRIIHVNTPPVYRKRALRDFNAVIRFKRGPGKRRKKRIP